MKLLFENWRKYLNKASVPTRSAAQLRHDKRRAQLARNYRNAWELPRHGRRERYWKALVTDDDWNGQSFAGYTDGSFDVRSFHKEIDDKQLEAENVFYDWLVNDIKDNVFIKWIKTHAERAEWVAPRHAVYQYRGATDGSDSEYKANESGKCMPKKIQSLQDYISLGGEICDLDLFTPHKCEPGSTWKWTTSQDGRPGPPDAVDASKQYPREYWATSRHINKIKIKFPYDVDPEADCAQKMKLLDEIVKRIIICPPPRNGGALQEWTEKIGSETQFTPYEVCTIELTATSATEKEMAALELSGDKNETPT